MHVLALLLVTTLLLFYLRHGQRARQQLPYATPKVEQRPYSSSADSLPHGLNSTEAPATKESRVADSAERVATTSSAERTATADRAERTAAEGSLVAVLGLSLGGALGSALSSTLRRLDESESAESTCGVDNAAAGDTPPCTSLQ